MSEKKDKPNPNLAIWEQSDKPPATALKQIKGGRISGMTDINPQWRFHKLTELFGACGEGWWTEETRREFVPCGEEIAVFVDINLFIKGLEHPIQGNGGNVFRVSESRGLRLNDEAIKMATTDAISVCCKQLGIGSAIYEGRWDGSKYLEDAPNPQPQKPAEKPMDELPMDHPPAEKLTAGDIKWRKMMAECRKALGDKGYTDILGTHGWESSKDIADKSIRKAVYDHMQEQIKANAERTMNEEEEI